MSISLTRRQALLAGAAAPIAASIAASTPARAAAPQARRCRGARPGAAPGPRAFLRLLTRRHRSAAAAGGGWGPDGGARCLPLWATMVALRFFWQGRTEKGTVRVMTTFPR